MEKFEGNPVRIQEVQKIKEKADDLQKYLVEFFSQNGVEMPEIKIVNPNELPEVYRKQFDAFNDERLNGVRVILVPDFWKLSESHADRQLIIFRQEYFEDKRNNDRKQWMSHELGHCQKFLDSPSKDSYFKDMKTPAFTDILAEYAYPNNKVEEYAFTKQFESVKNLDTTRDELLKLLKEDYQDENDFIFFNRILNKVY